ncbi:hypothetical protein TNCV_1303111 [Trichonephila clavipes]|nr:hypothetical protein TNCV_1303111 [Trichonephila clavipes]
MEHKNLYNDCQKTKEIEEEDKFKDLQSFSLAHRNQPENFQSEDHPTENVEIGGYTSLNTPPRCCYNIDDNFMEHQAIDTRAFDHYSRWPADFHFDQFNLPFNAVDPNFISTELKQRTTDELLIGDSAPESIIETTSDLNIGTVPWNINCTSEISDGQFELLRFSQFDLFHSKENTSLPKETSLDSFSDNFQVDQSNLPFRVTDPNSGSVEFKQNTADELFFEESASGWKIETTSDIRFAMGSRNTNYDPEGTRGQYGSLTSSQLNLFDSNRRTSLTKEILLDAISGRENEIRFENVEPKHKQMKPNSIVNGLISLQSYTNTGIAVEGYDLSTNENHSNFEIKIHRPLYFKQFKSENPAQKYLHSHEENFQYGVQELNVSQVRNLSESKPTHSNKKNFHCSLCKRKFFYESRLNKHILIHTEEKPFPCQLCEKKVILTGGPTAVFWRQKFFAKKRQIEGFQNDVNDEKFLESACVSEGMKWAFRKDEIE